MVKVHANDLVSAHSYLSSFPIPFHHPSQLDTEKSAFHFCLAGQIEKCEYQFEREKKIRLLSCIVDSYRDCVDKYPHKDDPAYHMASRGLKHCHNKHYKTEKLENL